jgi:hypothetical protein
VIGVALTPGIVTDDPLIACLCLALHCRVSRDAPPSRYLATIAQKLQAQIVSP